MKKLPIIVTTAALMFWLSAYALASNSCVGGGVPDVDLVIDIEGGAEQDIGNITFDCTDPGSLTVMVQSFAAPFGAQWSLIMSYSRSALTFG